MKLLRFVGDSLKALRAFPSDARQDAGFQLDRVQRGEQPDDFKAMPSIGPGVEELRIREPAGTYRVIYTARLDDAVYVCCMLSRKRPERPPGRTSRWLESVSGTSSGGPLEHAHG